MGDALKSNTPTGTAWLAVASDGSWNLVGWSAASGGDSSAGESADTAVEGLDNQIYRLHEVAFAIPDPPGEIGVAISVEIGDGELAGVPRRSSSGEKSGATDAE